MDVAGQESQIVGKVGAGVDGREPDGVGVVGVRRVRWQWRKRRAAGSGGLDQGRGS